MDLNLTGKIALVTGSNRGTGEVIARTLAAEGATVIFHSNSQDSPASAAEDLPRAHIVWGDLSSDNGAEQVAEQACAAAGDIDILVNNYGTAAPGKWNTSSTEDWLEMYQKNVLSAVRLIQRLTPTMKTNNWGRIVQLGTIGSHQPNAIMPHYYAAKGALATMGVSLAKDLANTGITVNTVSPGYIRTPELEAGFRLKAEKKGWGSDWAVIEQKIVETEFPNPCGRIAERQEVADLVAFICSDKAGFINGQNIRIDGGAVRYV
ncbi:MAG: 3-oxoacyl-[acyl-carrier protein] reductase [Bacteroidia bacterium]